MEGKGRNSWRRKGQTRMEKKEEGRGDTAAAMSHLVSLYFICAEVIIHYKLTQTWKIIYNVCR